MREVVLQGYSPSNKPVWIIWEDCHLYVFYPLSGRKRRWNDEYYRRDFSLADFRLSFLNAGYRIVR